MDAAGSKVAEPLHVQIGRKLNQGCISTDSLSCSIFKVPNHLRQVNEAAYEPQAISIGPYHRGKNHLQTIQVYKWHYLKMLLKRREETSLETYVTELEKLESDARRFYSERLDHIGGGELIEMMLLDGCFVVELIRKSAMPELRGKDDPLLTHYILRTVLRDLLLVENQLPFFILKRLFDMTVMRNQRKDFVEMTVDLFSNHIMPGFPGPPTKNTTRSIKHILGLLHDRWVCEEEEHTTLVSGPAVFLPRPRNRLSAPDVSFPISDSEELIHFEQDRISREADFESAVSCPISDSEESINSEKNISREADFDPEPFVMSAQDVRFPISVSGELREAPDVRFPISESADFTILAPDAKLNSGPEKSAPAVSCPISDSEESINSEQNVSRDVIISISEPDTKPSSREGKLTISAQDTNTKPTSSRFISSATELKEAGVRFRAREGKCSLFDIKFDKGKGVLSIPTLAFNDDTESILRNFIAYEQCSYDISPESKRFTNYITFMDCLVNTEKDVELLCRKEVIENWLGDHQVVASIFNRIRDHVLLPESFCYAKIFEQVNEYCKRDLNRWMANLRHNYFNTPWALISFIAAVFLLLLTVMQSVYTALSYHFA